MDKILQEILMLYITNQKMSQVNCDESGAKTILDNILTNNKTVQTAIKLAIEKEYDLR